MGELGWVQIFEGRIGMVDAKVRNAKLSELVPDPMNANKGTERGAYMVRRSLEKLGAGRSVLVDKHGVLIAGNKL